VFVVLVSKLEIVTDENRKSAAVEVSLFTYVENGVTVRDESHAVVAATP
jgi:hypothetical protein